MGTAVRDDGPDLLSDVLVSLRVRGRVFCRSEFTAPWSIAFPRGRFAHFHVVQRGRCRLFLGREERLLRSGDIVVLPHGSGHTLGDRPGLRSHPLSALTPADGWGPQAVIRHGGGGAVAQLLCGGFEFEGPTDHPLLAQLPEVLHVDSERGAGQMIEATLRLLDIAAAGSPGSDLLRTHLLAVAFVQLLRSWAEDRRVGWLHALRDRHMGQALRLMHAAPARRWSLNTLARHVGLSRSTFAARFSNEIGVSPLAYLERWRLDLAASLLRRERVGLEELADRVGYASAPSFSRAFRRRFAATPGEYRKRHGRVQTPPPRARSTTVG
ncbi:MAG: cupin domain-containing protein [Vicinamibacteraceae bacterium]